MLNETMMVALLVTQVLEKLNVPYLIGGSLASTVHGEIRATFDVDIVAELRVEHIKPLVQTLKSTFYIDADTIQAAIQRRSSFNIIHLATMFKVDIFIPKHRPYSQAQLAKRTAQVVVDDPAQTAFVASAEDTILAKLEWYRLGGETSERQWRDVLGVLKVQAGRLDLAYMQAWAQEINVSDLLEQALKAAYPQGQG